MSIVGKILSYVRKIAIDRIRNGVERRAGWIQKRKNGATFFTDFTHFEKAFDSVHRETLWVTMQNTEFEKR